MIINFLSALILSGKFRFFLTALAAIITYHYIGNLVVTDAVFLGIGLIAMAYSYKFVNIYSMILIITLMRVIEIGLRDTFGMINAYTYYLTYAAIDIGVIFLLVFKMPLIHFFRVTLYNNSNIQDLNITTADFILGAIYSMYLILSLIMIGEHFIRHLDSVPLVLNGVYAAVRATISNETLAKAEINNELQMASYLSVHVKFFYNSYEWIKLPLNMLEHIAILATSYRFMRKKSAFVT